LKVTKSLGISKNELFSNIIGFYSWGSHRTNTIKINQKTQIDPFFVEGYALYLAEGDTGFHGKTKPRKFRFTNSEQDVIKLFVKWIEKYFPGNNYYINIVHPKNGVRLVDTFKLTNNNIVLNEVYGKYNKITKYRVCFDSAIIIDLFLALESKIKAVCFKDKKLAAAYLRGMMIGEGTAYLNKSRYVRIEMRNEKEIKYLHRLFTLLGFQCKPSLRKKRHNMWSLYIGAKQLKKYKELIGFGIHNKRQQILEKSANKKLRKNQYI
jgi:hypothetical protein